MGSSNEKTTGSSSDETMQRILRGKGITNPPAWISEPGTVVRATVIGLKMSEPNEYGQYPIITYEAADGSIFAVHAFHTLLRETLQELGTKVGSEQILSYDGQ